MGEGVADAGRAHDAMKRHAWTEALAAFAEADAAGVLGPSDLRVYAEAAHWCSRTDLTTELSERAFTGFQAAGAKSDAGEVALSLCGHHIHLRQNAIGSGWLRRAERILADVPECASHGRLAWTRSMMAQGRGAFDEALAHATSAVDIAERTGDRDGLALALLRRGRVLVKLGRVTEGMADVDEAMVAAMSGELAPDTTGRIYCATIAACHDLCDYDRAGEWTDAARRWCERKSITGFPGICRVHRAELLRLRGKFREAESEARRASEELREFGALDITGEAFYEIGEIRLRMGDLDEAMEAFRQAHELGRDPQPGLAQVWFERGRIDTALGLISGAVADIPREDALRRVRLLPALVEIALAGGELDAAKAAAGELETSAKRFTTPGIDAAACSARGAIEVATGDAKSATATLRRAVQLWQQLDAPFECAQARLALAHAYRAQRDDESAQLETAAARVTLEKLGAVLALQKTREAVPVRRAVVDLCPDSPPAPGDVIDERFELLRLVGGGGMGMVFEAKNQRTGRHVAVKLLRRELATDPEACQRLLQEAIACGRIQHPNVVDVYDAGIHRARPYVAMELLRGESLGARLDRVGHLPIAEALRILRQSLAGLGAAHKAGIVHRDIKPDNLFLVDGGDGEETVKVLDFGISKLVGPESKLTDTKTGMIVGTPFYMSPEQAQGKKEIDQRTDIYGLGAVLFHALTGRTPFEGDNYNALLAAILTTDVPRPRSLRAEIPLALEAVILRAMARDTGMRYRSADELCADLRAAAA